MPASKKLDASGDSPSGKLSNIERQEEILRSLSELTRLRPNDRSLSPDFRLQLQLLECSLQQHRLLQQVAEQQRRAAVQLEAMHCQGTQSQEVMQQRLSEVAEGLEKVGHRLERHEAAAFGGGLRDAAVGRDVVVTGLGGSFDEAPLPPGPQKQAIFHRSVSELSIQAKGAQSPATSFRSAGKSRSNLQELLKKASTEMDDELLKEELDMHHKEDMEALATTREDAPHPCWRLARIVKAPWFDILCGAVISCNAFTMGLQSNHDIQWRLANPSSRGEAPVSDFIRMSGYFYMCFYLLELLSKLIVFRWQFLFSDQWKWNLFDSLLVLVGIYDIVVDALSKDTTGGTADVGFMRLLRLLRMTKLLRVVRVMRIFRVLRMMLNSIAGSMMTLMWSILMLSLMMYVFSLCFIQIIEGFLSDTPASEIPKETLDGIQMYWGNVYQSIITLYYAVTGGADWEPLAQPVREAGELYYLLFLFYIAFTAFAVLNVLTGLYVDTATKISERDDESVGEELIQRPETQRLRSFFKEIAEGKEDYQPKSDIGICIQDFSLHRDADATKDFLKMAELTMHDCRRIFRMLDFEGNGRVNLEEFIAGCLHSKSASQALDMITLLSECKRTYIQNRIFMGYVEDRFDQVCDVLDTIPCPDAMAAGEACAPSQSKPNKERKK